MLYLSLDAGGLIGTVVGAGWNPLPAVITQLIFFSSKCMTIVNVV